MSWISLDTTLDILGIAVVISTVFTVFLLTLPDRYVPRKDDHSVQIVVLGDIGRSPRMQYHALSVAKNGGKVYLVGYVGKRSRFIIQKIYRALNITQIQNPIPIQRSRDRRTSSGSSPSHPSPNFSRPTANFSSPFSRP